MSQKRFFSVPDFISFAKAVFVEVIVEGVFCFGEPGKGDGFRALADRALLKDALLRTAQAAKIAGIRAILVHAKDDAARKWYLQWGFEPSPTDLYHLFLLIKDLLALLK